MPFERVERNIRQLQAQSLVTAEDVVDSMSRLLMDAKDYNNSLGTVNFTVGNIENYALSLQNLLLELNYIFSEYAARLNALNDEDLNKVHANSEQALSEIKEKEAILHKLFAEKKLLEERTNEIIEKEEEISVLKSEIINGKKIISDRESELSQKKTECKGVKDRQEVLKGQLLEIEKSLNELEKNNEINEKLKVEALKKEDELKRIAKQYELWLETISKENASQNQQYAEANNCLQIITNGWRSLQESPDYMDFLGEELANGKLCKEFKTSSDLDNWFATMHQHIFVLLKVYAETYNNVIEIMNGELRVNEV